MVDIFCLFFYFIFAASNWSSASATSSFCLQPIAAFKPLLLPNNYASFSSPISQFSPPSTKLEKNIQLPHRRFPLPPSLLVLRPHLLLPSSSPSIVSFVHPSSLSKKSTLSNIFLGFFSVKAGNFRDHFILWCFNKKIRVIRVFLEDFSVRLA